MSAEDLYEHRLWFVRQWPYPLHLYLRGACNADWIAEKLHLSATLRLLTEKTTGDLKAIPIPQDQERLDWVMQRLVSVNKYVRKRKLPPEDDVPAAETLARRRDALPPVLRDPRVCPSCAFWTFCAPELAMPVGSAEILDQPDLETLLEEREKLVQSQEKYDELDRDPKAILSQFRVIIGARGKAYLLCGRFLITVSEIQPRGRSAYLKYDVWRRPDETQA